MKNLLILFLTQTIYLNSFAQCVMPLEYEGNTGSNMTVFLTSGVVTALPLTSDNPYIVALTGSGLLVGSASLAQSDLYLGQQSLAVWGDDSSTPEIDGALAGEGLYFQLVNGNSLYDLDLSFAGPNSYTTNGTLPAIGVEISINCLYGCTAIWAENYNANATDDDGSCYLNGCKDSLECNYNEYVTIDDGSCIFPGCTDNSKTEYYNQGYLAGCDDGSCSRSINDLDIDPTYFYTPSNTGSSMTIGFNNINNPALEGSMIGAFTDLNNDGNIEECVGLTYYQNDFFTIALWGDDSTTDEIDGLSEQSDLVFAILNSFGNVVAFNPEPAFSGYATNTFTTILNLDFDVTIYGCMDSSFCNYNEEAEEDDGSCAGIPGCTDNDYLEYNANASCNLDGACVITWQDAYTNEIEISAFLQASLDSATIAIANLEDSSAFLQASLDSATIAIANLEDSIANYSSPISIDILPGWNIIGYTLDESQDAVASFEEIVDYIEIVKNNAADVYWPEFGFNGIGDLIPGQGYQIKVTQAIEDFMYPNTNGQRIELSPTVPQWVIDMPIETHPNDIRTLIRTVNLLGQEIELNNTFKGSTIIYLYSDGTVEKKIY